MPDLYRRDGMAVRVMMTYAQAGPPLFSILMPQDTPAAGVQASSQQADQRREPIAFAGANEARELISRMINQGSRRALLFSRDLEPLLYNNREFEDGLVKLLRSSPRSYCHVLVQNAEDLFKHDHRLMAVNQRLSSYMEIRLVADEARDVMENFIVVDHGAYLQRPNSAVYQGVANFDDPARVRELSHAFLQWWEQSGPLPGSRRLNI